MITLFSQMMMREETMPEETMLVETMPVETLPAETLPAETIPAAMMQKLLPRLRRMAEVMRVTADFIQLADMNRQGLRFPVEGTGGSRWGGLAFPFAGTLPIFKQR